MDYRYDSQGRDGDGHPQNDHQAGTRPLRQNRTSRLTPQQIDAAHSGLVLLEDTQFVGSQVTYTIRANGFINAGGEASVYEAVAVETGARVAAKIYSEVSIDMQKLNARKSIYGTIMAYSDFHRYHLMPIFDFGTVSVMIDADTRLLVSYFIDIMPLVDPKASLATVGKVSYQKIKTEYLPPIVTAIETLHANNLVHRDVKPENLYWYQGEIVLGDYGTVGIIHEDKNASIATRTGRGTIGYSAPEVSSQYAVRESDFFSLGCTIATFYNGKHCYAEEQRNNDASAIAQKMGFMESRYELPFELLPGDELLKPLILGLTATNYAVRINLEEVRKFCNHPYPVWNPVIHKTEGLDEFQITFDNVLYTRKADLAEAMASKWTLARDYLYKGGEKNSVFVGGMGKYDQMLAQKAMEIIETEVTARNPDLGLAQMIHYLSPNTDICWMGVRYKKIADIFNEMKSQLATPLPTLMFMLMSGFLSWKFSELKMPDSDVDTLRRIEQKANEEKVSKLAYYLAMFYMMDERNDPAGPTPFDAQALFLEEIPFNGMACKHALDFLDNDLLLAWFVRNGADTFDLKQIQSDQILNNITQVFRFFEAVCPDPQIVRETYITFGPYSYLTWFLQNQQLYDFHGTQAMEESMRIRQVQLDAAMSIDQLDWQFNTLKGLCDNIQTLFQNNLLLAYLGVAEGKDINGITATSENAYFTTDFLGMRVPLGYKRFLIDNGYRD